MQWSNLREDIRRWGLIKALYLRAMRRVEKRLGFRLFVIHTRRLDPNTREEETPTGCSARLLTVDELIKFALDPALDLDSDAVAGAYARGDVCFGYLEQDTLVAYTWKSTVPTRAEDGLWVRFGEGYSYGYKAFTLPSHRGRHLQEHLIHASEHWRMSHGSRYNIGYIDLLNLSSIAADRRYGNRAIGYAGYIKWFGLTFPFRSRGVKSSGFQFFIPEPARAPTIPTPTATSVPSEIRH